MSVRIGVYVYVRGYFVFIIIRWVKVLEKGEGREGEGMEEGGVSV